MNTAANLSAPAARCAILDLADTYSFETILTALVIGMSGDEARESLEYLIHELTN